MRHTLMTRKALMSSVASAVAALALGTASAASASEKARIKSRFTTIELKTCEAGKNDDQGGTWTCKGLNGYPVFVAQGNYHLRQFISFGSDGKSRRAATQTLKSINTLFGDGMKRATIEWRFRRADGRDVPYATIVRLYTAQADAELQHGVKVQGEVLVVTKVTPTEACQLALIDARANPDAIMLARSAADELSAAFDCKADQPRVVGATGRSPM
jgi:hypothetical protein